MECAARNVLIHSQSDEAKTFKPLTLFVRFLWESVWRNQSSALYSSILSLQEALTNPKTTLYQGEREREMNRTNTIAKAAGNR